MVCESGASRSCNVGDVDDDDVVGGDIRSGSEDGGVDYGDTGNGLSMSVLCGSMIMYSLRDCVRGMGCGKGRGEVVALL